MEGKKGRRDRLAYTGRGFSGDAADRSTPATAVHCHNSSLTAGKHLPALYKLGGKDNIGIKMEGNMLEVEQKEKREEKKQCERKYMLSFPIHGF